MNVLKFELKSIYKSTIIWTLTILAFFYSFSIGVFPIMNENADLLNQAVASMPQGFAQAFGVDMSLLMGFEGFYNFSFMYLSVMGAIMASSITINVFSKEKRAKCSDFIFSKPIKRQSLFGYKLLAVIIALLVSNCFYVIASITTFSQHNIGLNEAFMASLSLLLTQLIFVAIGIIISQLSKKIRSVSALSTMIGFIAFAISALVNIIEVDYIEYLSPLKFFEPIKIFTDGGYNLSFIIWASVIILLCIGISFVSYTKKDTAIN